MTKAPKPKLGEGVGVAEKVGLLPGEVPVGAWDALFYPKWWRFRGGVLYLTTARLIWISWRPALPWVPRTVSISLPDVERVYSRRVLFAPFIALAGPFHRQVVVALRDSRRHAFAPLSTGPGAGEIVAEITSILRERGLSRD